MDLPSLRQRLEAEHVRPDAYSFTGTGCNECYCLASSSPTAWVMYYAERGLRTAEQHFTSEDAACRAFLELVLSEPTTRQV